jgi:hypothetical protein
MTGLFISGDTMRPAKILLPLLLLASLGVQAAPLDDALQAFNSGKYSQAAELLAPLARSGNAVAQQHLGLLYYHGSGVKEDELAAAALWKKSAAQGNVEAMFRLAYAYTFSEQVARTVGDPELEAVKMYFDAANAGHAEAQFNLGMMFLTGKGVVKDRSEALRWIQMAAAQGHPEAKSFLTTDSGNGK